LLTQLVDEGVGLSDFPPAQCRKINPIGLRYLRDGLILRARVARSQLVFGGKQPLII
jgi:hypothetical protein